MPLIACMLLYYACSTHHYCASEANAKAEHIVINNDLPIDSSMYKYILPYKNKIDKDLNVEIAYTHTSLEKNSQCNNLAQLVYESMKQYADSVLGKEKNFMVLINYGGLRSNIAQGKIFKKNIYELMPFDNSIVILQLNDEQMNALQNAAKSSYKLLLKSKQNNPTNILVTSDYLYQGGDDCKFLSNAQKIKSPNYFIRDIIIRYCLLQKNINSNCFYQTN